MFYIPDLSDQMFQEKIAYYNLFNTLKPKGKKILKEIHKILFEYPVHTLS